MKSGLVNTNSGSSAFVAILNNKLKVESIRIYTLNYLPVEITDAAAWDLRSGNNIVFGVISTNIHHHFFRADIQTEGYLDTLSIYANPISYTSLLSFRMPQSNFNYFGYFYQTYGGDRKIHVNWKKTMNEDSNVLLLSKPGYDVYHTKEQLSSGNALWSGYVFQNQADPCKVLLLA